MTSSHLWYQMPHQFVDGALLPVCPRHLCNWAPCNANFHKRQMTRHKDPLCSFLVRLAIDCGPYQVTLPSISAIPQPIQATRKRWYDKLADAILGDDESSVSVPASRYALICQKCFAHNGLVKESQWEGARGSPLMFTGFSVTTSSEYICFKCGFFNPSARSKKQLAVPRTPSPLSSGPSPIRSADHKLQSITGPEQSPDRHSASNELQNADDSIVVGTEWFSLYPFSVPFSFAIWIAMRWLLCTVPFNHHIPLWFWFSSYCCSCVAEH